jgi:hypothetical protein
MEAVMKRMLILLMLVSLPARAEWVEVMTGEKDGASSTIYIDSGTLRKTSDGRRMWVMYSYEKRTQVEGNGRLDYYKSSRVLEEFDCQDKRIRSLEGLFYTEPMLKGSMVVQYVNPTRWEFQRPNSVGEGLLKGVCGMPLK